MSGHNEFCVVKSVGVSWEAQAEIHLEWTERGRKLFRHQQQGIMSLDDCLHFASLAHIGISRNTNLGYFWQR